MYSLCNRSLFFFWLEGNRSLKAGQRSKEEAIGVGGGGGEITPPPHALFLSFYFGTTFALPLHSYGIKKTPAMHAT